MTKNYKIHAYNIIYDITEEDTYNGFVTIEEIQNKLPHELDFEIAFDEDEEELGDVIVNHISDLIGWPVKSLGYTLLSGPARYEVRFDAELTDEEIKNIEEYLWQTLHEQFGISAEFIEVNLINNK